MQAPWGTLLREVGRSPSGHDQVCWTKKINPRVRGHVAHGAHVPMGTEDGWLEAWERKILIVLQGNRWLKARAGTNESALMHSILIIFIFSRKMHTFWKQRAVVWKHGNVKSE